MIVVKIVRACIGGGILLLIIHLIVKPLIEEGKNYWKRSSKTVIEKKIPDTVWERRFKDLKLENNTIDKR